MEETARETLVTTVRAVLRSRVDEELTVLQAQRDALVAMYRDARRGNEVA